MERARLKSTELHATVKNIVEDFMEHLKQGSCVDAVVLVDALTRLCLTNSSLQTAVGDALAPHMATFVPSLYNPVLCVSCAACLAACTHNHRLNQRRLVRRVPGWSIPAAPTASEHVTSLYVICIPERVRLQWRQWRRRQRNLRGHRIPHGTPPAAELGTPAPCYCNTCLGTMQLYSTWLRHFNAFDRWKADDVAASSAKSSGSLPPTTSLETYVQMALLAHGPVQRHRVACIVDMIESSDVRDDGGACHVYSITDQSTDVPCPTIDPLRDVIAIQVFRDIPSGEGADALEAPGAPTGINAPNSVNQVCGEDDLSLDVVLLDAARRIRCCSPTEAVSSNDPVAAMPHNSTAEFHVQVAANVALQHLVIHAVDAGTKKHQAFRALVPAASLTLASPLALLQLSLGAIHNMLDTACVVCRHSTATCPSQRAHVDAACIVLSRPPAR
ncbi:hypothetical protein H310_01727, partial [Aphanomyces invadans]